MQIRIAGVLLCKAASALTEQEIEDWGLRFLEKAVPTELMVDPTTRFLITVEGVPSELRSIGDLGKSAYLYASIASLDENIRSWKAGTPNLRAPSGDAHISLGIGSADFCATYMRAQKFTLPEVSWRDVDSLIEDLQNFDECSVSWVSSWKTGWHSRNLRPIT